MTTSSGHSEDVSGTPPVVALLIILVVLVLILVLLYKRLNSLTEGQYTVHRLIYSEGGFRDQLRERVRVVETHIGVLLWPQPAEDEEAISQGVGNADEGMDKEVEDEERGDDSSGDLRLSEIDLKERANVRQDAEGEGKEDQEEGGENEQSFALLIDLADRPLSGSAVWSGEEKTDMTAL